MDKKIKILIPLAVLAVAAAAAAYLKYPVGSGVSQEQAGSRQQGLGGQANKAGEAGQQGPQDAVQSGQMAQGQASLPAAASPAAEVDAATAALVQAYDGDQAVVLQEDSDADYVNDNTIINSLSEAYNENEF